MNDTDAFFTHTIVGAPLSVLLGRQAGNVSISAEGMVVHMPDGTAQLSRGWQEWLLSSQAGEAVGQPRMRPKRMRRILERHAFWIALLGLFSASGTAIFWTLVYWGLYPWI